MLGVFLGSGMDSYRQSRKQRKDEEAQQWYQEYQERAQQLEEELKRSQEDRAKERYDYEKGNLWDIERQLADLQAQGLGLDVGLKRELNPYKVKEAEWQDKTNQFNYENVLPAQLEKLLIGNQSDQFTLDYMMPAQLENLLIGNKSGQFTLDYMLPEQLKAAQLDNQLAGKQLDWYDPRQRAEIENLYSLADARQGGTQSPTGPFIPKNAQEQKEVYLNLRKMMGRADTMEEFMNALTEYGPVLHTMIGPELYQSLIDEVAQKTGVNPEQYFVSDPIPGDLVGSYLQNLGAIDQFQNIKPKPDDRSKWQKFWDSIIPIF